MDRSGRILVGLLEQRGGERNSKDRLQEDRALLVLGSGLRPSGENIAEDGTCGVVELKWLAMSRGVDSCSNNWTRFRTESLLEGVNGVSFVFILHRVE